MRFLKAQVDDQTHENLHTIAQRRNLTVATAIRVAASHYLTTFPLDPLEGNERRRLQKRGASAKVTDENTNEVSFLELFDAIEAQEDTNGL